MSLVKADRERNGTGVDRSAFPSLFNTFLNDLWTPRESEWMPAVNITERADEYQIDLAVPGMNKKDFRVEVDNGIITVSGERKEEKKTEGDVHARREFHYGSFMRTFTLPDSADGEKVNASYKDGILSVVVGKREEAKRKPKKQIQIS